jgi:acetyl esterase/lipase
VFPAQIHDLKAAVRWLRANAAQYGIDPERVGAWGESSGAHLVALLGTSAGVPMLEGTLGPAGPSSAVRAVVDWYGPTDFLQMDAHRLPEGMAHDPADSPESRLVGGPIQSRKVIVQAANPVTYVGADDPPFLIFHGDRDPLVPHHQSVLLHAALAAAGVPVTLHTLAGAGHGTPEFRTPEVGRAMVEFFDRHVKGQAR